MDDAQKRAQAFNAEARIVELEDLLSKVRLGSAVERKAISELLEEVAALNDLAERTSKIHRKTTKELKQSLRVLLAHAEGKRKITTAQFLRARWRLREPGEASKTLQQMRDDGLRTGLDKALDVTPDDVVAMQNKDHSKQKAPKTQRDVFEYVNALADDAAAHHEKLGDVGQLIEGDDALFSTPKRKPTKKTKKASREERSRIIREAGKKDRKVLDRLRDRQEAMTDAPRAYELWSFETGNCVGVCPTLDAALDIVEKGVAGKTRAEAEAWVGDLALVIDIGVAGEREAYAEATELLDIVLDPHRKAEP